MNDTQSLELQLKTTGEETLKVLDKLSNALTKLDGTLGKIKTSTNAIENIGKTSEKAVAKVDKLGNSFSKLFSFVAAKRIGLGAMKFLDDATNRAEELNLFNVIFKNIEKNGVKTFSTVGGEAYKFQNKLNEAFGTNMTETLRYQGLFQAMATNQGIDEKHAAIMSENMLKLTYDLASLYNKSEKTTAEALRGGVYAGQTKPLRNFGIDVTQTSLKPVLASLGITDRTVNDMNQAEKEILRYISTLNQAKAAMGDFAETIESPANQLKIFKQQLVELRTAWGNLFMGLYAQILPYANAILMVLKEIAKAIANFFGIETRDYNSGIGALEDTYDGLENVGSGANKAAKAAKELKRQILGFDQINNLTTPSKTGTGSGTGSGGGLAGGIDKRLLEAISGYDNLMDKVRMKANEIRDRWMEILGFKKEINPLTGEMEWKYQGLGTTIKNLWNRFLELNPQVRLFVGALSIGAIIKIVAAIKKLSSALGVSGLFKSITGLFTPLKTMFSYAKEINKNLSTSVTGTDKLKTSLKDGIDVWHKTASGWEKMKAGLEGIIMSAAGIALMENAIDDIIQNGPTVINLAEGVGGAFATIFGGIQTGAAIGGSTGALIGGIVGSIPVVIEAIKGISNAFDDNKIAFEKLKKEVDDGYNNWIQSSKDINDAFSKTDSTWDYYSRLNEELTQIVDENGNIKEGYEDRAEFIVGELSRALGIEIELSGKTIKKYKEVEKQIVKLIEQKKAMAKLNALEQEYNKALAEQGPAEERKRKAYEELNKQIEKHIEMMHDPVFSYSGKYSIFPSQEQIFDYLTGLKNIDDLVKETGWDYEDMSSYLKTATSYTKDAAEEYGKASKELDGWNSTIDTWDKLYGLSLKGKYKEINDYSEHTRNILGKDINQRTDYWKQVVADQDTNLKMLEKDRKNMSEETYNARKKEYEKERKLAEDELAKINLIVKTKNGDLSKDTIEAWRKMGKNSTDEFKAAFSELPDDVKLNLINGLEKNKKGLSKDLQKYFKEIKPTLTVDVKGNVSPLTEAIKKTIKKFAPFIGDDKINSILKKYNLLASGGVFNGSSWKSMPQYANGGMPNHGTAFVAGENGAEIVGNINRRTEVLNRSQIASAIYSAVASAMSNANIGNGEIHLYAHTDEGVVIDRINQKTKQTGVCPINIPA